MEGLVEVALAGAVPEAEGICWRGGKVENLSQSEFGPFHIDVRERLLTREGRPVPLTPKAFDLLAAFVAQPGRVLTKQELLDKVWPDTFVEEANLAYNVFALRKALDDPADSGLYIETVPRRGYRFSAVVTPVNGGSSLARVAIENWAAPGNPVAELPGTAGDREAEPATTSRDPVWMASSIRRPAAWVTLVSVLAAASLAVYHWRGSSIAEPPHAIPLTSMRGVVRSPSLDPEGHYVVFTWIGPGQSDAHLYVQLIGAGRPLQLTKGAGNDYSPSWSPDGLTIAFLRRAPDSTSSEVRVIAPLGGSERVVGHLQPRLSSFRTPSLGWCPDSTCVVASDAAADGKTDAVFVLFLETGEKRQLTFPTAHPDLDPAISPDGHSLIFRRSSTPFSGEFYRLPLRDDVVPAGEPVRVTPTLSAGRPAWMPDSRKFLFSARGALWWVDAVDGGAPQRLPFVGQDGQSPVVSRAKDGRQRLTYVRSFADGNIWRVDVPAPGAAAASPVPAIGSTRSDGTPSLSPDGRRVAFMSNREGESEIWVASPDGSDPVAVTALGVLPGFPRWSPDGQVIAFHADPRERPDVLVVPARGGKARILETNGPSSAYPSFSRDGRWIYFSAFQAGTFRIWKMPSSGGAAMPVTNNAGSIAIESYDGRDLYYVSATERGALWRWPLSGGSPVKLLDGVILGAFDVVDKGIYYIDRTSGEPGGDLTGGAGGQTRLQYFDFATGGSTTVAGNLGTVGLGMSASRDGSVVYFTRIDSAVDEIMLVDNFR